METAKCRKISVGLTPTASTQSDRSTRQCSAYMKIHMTVLMFARHTGQQSSVATLFDSSLKSERVRIVLEPNPSRGATRQTSQQSAGSSAAAAAGHGAVEVVAVDAVDCSSSSSLLSLSVAGCNAAVWAPTEWLTARRNRDRRRSRSNLDRHALTLIDQR